MAITLFDTVVGKQKVTIRVVSDNPAASSISIRRTMKNTTSVVRGADMVPYEPGGVVVIADYEVLYNSPLTYQVTVYDVNAAVIETATAPVVSVPGTSVWLRDIVYPSLSVPLRLVGQDSGDHSSEMRQALLRPLGRPNPVVTSDVRSGATGSSVALTMTTAEYDGLEKIFASGHVLLFTGPADWEIRWPLNIVVGNLKVARASEALDASRLWTFDWFEVDPPPPTQFTAVQATIWQSLVDAGTIWLDIDQTSWLDVIFPVARAARMAWSA